MRLALFVLLLLAAPVAAQDAGSAPQPVPDASVGEGGSEREEDDTTVKVPLLCQRSSDCSQGFSCAAGRCTWVGTRKAERIGCLAHAWAELIGAFALAFVLHRAARR